MWLTNPITKVGVQRFGMIYTSVIFATEHRRHCGCHGDVGVRMDFMEPVFFTGECSPEHAHIIQKVNDEMRNMPPQEESVIKVFERLFERYVEPETGDNNGKL